MNEAFEKILDRLEERKQLHERMISYEHENGTITEEYQARKVVDVLNDAKQIVQEVAEEYTSTEHINCSTDTSTNGWIACSEKLPELRQDVLVTVKYTGFMGMHGYWIKTVHMEAENDWWGDCAGGEVIAWQPLPEPFKERD